LSNRSFGGDFDRRSFVKGSALASGAFFINSKHNHLKLADNPSSPFTTPWVQPLAFSPYKVPLPSFAPLDPVPDFSRNQRYDEFPAVDFYRMQTCEVMCRSHPQLAMCAHTSYDGMVPGPTFMMRYGRPVMVRIENCCPAVMPSFGSCDIITHIHNGHHAPESDGGPWDLYSPGGYRDNHYPNIYSGGDPLEAKGTLFYHDHCHDFTGPNVYRGLVGFFLLYDNLDSGNENDPNPDAFRLPSGVPDGKRVKNRYDIPIVLADRLYDQAGMLSFNTMEMDGILGDKYLVNGRVQPYFEVERRKYRFRILNSGISRFHDVWLSNGMTFQYIANDGNMLPAPMELNHVPLGVAERADIIVDFSQLPETTTELYLVNRAEQVNGRGPTGNTLPMATAPKMLKFIIRPGAVADNSRVPTSLRSFLRWIFPSPASAPSTSTARTACGPSTGSCSTRTAAMRRARSTPRKSGTSARRADGLTLCTTTFRSHAGSPATGTRWRARSTRAARMRTRSTPAIRSRWTSSYANSSASTRCTATTSRMKTTP